MTATALITPATPLPRVRRRPDTAPMESRPPIIYPESDGKPMADNTRQFDAIVMIQGGLASLFADRPRCLCRRRPPLVSGRRPTENPRRPGRHGGIWPPARPSGFLHPAPGRRNPPQVVFEVLSPGNTPKEMADKLRFYARHGVEEYYEYDPDRGTLKGWQRHGERLTPIPRMRGWISPRLGQVKA